MRKWSELYKKDELMNLLISYFDLNPSVLCGIGNNKILLRQERII